MADLELILKKLHSTIHEEDIIDEELDSVFAVTEQDEEEETGDEPAEGETETEVPEEESVPEEEPATEVPEEPGAGGEVEVPAEPGGDVGGMGDVGGLPGQEEEEPKTSEEIGRIFELKKIYSRLIAIEEYLGDTSDVILIRVRNFVSHGISLFETLISNIDSFKDKLDEIIVMYYEFLERVYMILKRYYEIKDEEQESKK